MARIVEEDQRMFMTGNEVLAWAALAAGAEIMYGYPITPQNEIMHYWTRLAPRFERGFLQTEDELSAGFTTLGGVMAGKRAFSATSGPGDILMQEPICMAEMMRIPAVWIIQQRGAPSTATVIYGQQETRMACFGGNGEGHRVVYSTSSHQELFDYLIKAFNTAWSYRFPTILLGDGYQGKMREAVTLYNPEAHGVKMVPTEPFVGRPGVPGVDRAPAHYRNTFNIEEEIYEIVHAREEEFEALAPQIVEFESGYLDEAEMILIGHGIVSRAIKEAVKLLQNKGVKVGYFRPVTLRPFPVKELRKAVEKVPAVMVFESALGQLLSMVKDAVGGLPVKIEAFLRPGVGICTDEVAEQVQEYLRKGSKVH